MLKKIRTLLLLLTFFSVGTFGFSQYSISGIVTNSENQPLDYASVFLKDTRFAVATNEDGSFLMEDIPAGDYVLKASFVGYGSFETPISLVENIVLNIQLEGTYLELDKIQILANRAELKSPVPNSNMKKEELETANLVHDVPYVLKWMPSVTVTSDAGTGIGYTGIRVRGSEASRTNVTINGVPLNDSESQSVFWVDLPDFMANTEEVQIQRGVGLSTNGTSAFGANVNLNTQKVNIKPYLTLAGTAGSFNTLKYSAQAGSGLISNKYTVDARYSSISSDGYIDRSRAAMTSAFFSAARVTSKNSLRFNFMSGHEITNQAWNGLPIQYLETDRTYNSAGTEKPGEPYNNEIDNYKQRHLQLIYNQSLTKNLKMNLTAHYTKGKGYYENFKGGEKLSDYKLTNVDTLEGNIIRRKWLDNDFGGLVYSMDHNNEILNTQFGGGVNYYLGRHFGEVPWNSFDTLQPSVEYYRNNATKLDWNNFVRLTGNFSEEFVPFVDLQVRYVDYRFEGPNDSGEFTDQDDQLFFFNPKVGASYFLNPTSKFFAYYGRANREPSRNEYVESSPSSRPKHETLNDFEIGFTTESKYIDANIVGYNMSYINQLVPTGRLNDVGEYTRVNVPKSYRRGVELGLNLKPLKFFTLSYSGTFSSNKIVEFDEYYDSWDTGEQIKLTHKNTDIAFSPNAIQTIRAIFHTTIKENHRVQAMISHKRVSKQYLDNSSNENTSIPAFSFTDLQFVYHFSKGWFKDISLNFLVGNVFNKKYYNNGWTYRFSSEGYNPVPDDPSARLEGNGVYNLTGVYPQALRNYTLGLTIKF